VSSQAASDTRGGPPGAIRPAETRDIGMRDPTSPRSFALWFGVLGPPLAWGAHLVLGDLIYELGCSRGVRGARLFGLPLDAWALIETSVLALVVAVAGLGAWRAWRTLRELSNGASLDRAQAVSLAGIASSLGYLLLISYGFLPAFFLRTCGTSL
jgi:hypothetical protein